MSNPAVRKKRNFKALALSVDTPPPPPEDVQLVPPVVKAAPANGPVAVVAATRAAPSAPGGKRRKPPAMDLTKSKTPAAEPVAKPQHSPNLLAVATPKSASISTSSPSRSSYHSLQERLATMDINGSDTSMDLKAEDLRMLSELGAGNGGTVSRVEHVPTGTIMAKKVRSQIRYVSH